MRAVIMAGGKGTRLASLTKGEIPKPMVPVLDKPLLLWQVEQLKEYGITEVTMIVGFLAEKVMAYFGDGSGFGIHVDYIEEKEPLGTAGSFYYLKERLAGEKGSGSPEKDYFLLIFGDVFFQIDLDRMERFHKAHGALATLFVHPNAHPFDSDLVKTDRDGRVVQFDSKHNVRNYWYDNCVNAGIYILDKSICDKVPEPVKTDFEKDILSPMAEAGEAVYAYRSPEFVKDVGTVDRIRKTIADIRSGFIEARNLRNKQRAIFLDRDGVINVLKGFLVKEEDFELIPGAEEAIGLINSSPYLAIVTTNQPQIARGELSPEGLETIFNKMKTLLGQKGVYLDDIFFCPHHPDRGFPGERPEYKIDCACRKPKTGMLKAAAEKYNIDLESSWVIGDMTQDVQFGKNGGCRTALVRTGNGGEDGKYAVTPDLVCADLLDAVRQILRADGITC